MHDASLLSMMGKALCVTKIVTHQYYIWLDILKYLLAIQILKSNILLEVLYSP